MSRKGRAQRKSVFSVFGFSCEAGRTGNALQQAPMCVVREPAPFGVISFPAEKPPQEALKDTFCPSEFLPHFQAVVILRGLEHSMPQLLACEPFGLGLTSFA